MLAMRAKVYIVLGITTCQGSVSSSAARVTGRLVNGVPISASASGGASWEQDIFVYEGVVLIEEDGTFFYLDSWDICVEYDESQPIGVNAMINIRGELHAPTDVPQGTTAHVVWDLNPTGNQLQNGVWIKLADGRARITNLDELPLRKVINITVSPKLCIGESLYTSEDYWDIVLINRLTSRDYTVLNSEKTVSYPFHLVSNVEGIYANIWAEDDKGNNRAVSLGTDSVDINVSGIQEDTTIYLNVELNRR